MNLIYIQFPICKDIKAALSDIVFKKKNTHICCTIQIVKITLGHTLNTVQNFNSKWKIIANLCILGNNLPLFCFLKSQRSLRIREYLT